MFPHSSNVNQNQPDDVTKNWFKFFQFNAKEERPSEVRNLLLVVFALIAAATFQAGVNPPGGVWQDDGNGHRAGRAVFASQQNVYTIFMLFNTLGFSSSILVIISLTYTFPFRVQIWVATLSMTVTYGSAVLAVTPHVSLKNRYIFATAFLPILLKCFIQFVYNKIAKCICRNDSK